MATDWQLKPSDLKRYPHFDKYLPAEEAVAIATDPERVAANPFFPFLRYIKMWKPYRPTDKPAKERPIRYASRRDAYIFARYRHLLAQGYETELRRLAIQDCPIAYRKIPVSRDSHRGKCKSILPRMPLIASWRWETAALFPSTSAAISRISTTRCYNTCGVV